jgi:hypothetical protein
MWQFYNHEVIIVIKCIESWWKEQGYRERVSSRWSYSE